MKYETVQVTATVLSYFSGGMIGAGVLIARFHLLQISDFAAHRLRVIMVVHRPKNVG